MYNTREYDETFLDLEKVKEKTYGYKSVDAVVAALCPLISELRDGVSIDEMALPWKVSKWKHGYLRKLSFRQKVHFFLSLSDCTPALKCSVTSFKYIVFYSFLFYFHHSFHNHILWNLTIIWLYLYLCRSSFLLFGLYLYRRAYNCHSC